MKKNEIGKQIILWVIILTIEGLILSTIGENKGTRQSFMWIPVLITMFGGLGYIILWMVLGSIKAKREKLKLK